MAETTAAELLGFERLWTQFECPETKQSILVVMYSYMDGHYTMHTDGQAESYMAFLSSVNARGTVGESFFHENVVLVSIGSTDEDIAVLRNNIRKSVPGVHRHIPSESEVSFAESLYTPDCIYSFVISSYSYDFLKKEKRDKRVSLRAEKYQKVVQIANAQNIARFLGDTPANLMTPSIFTEYAQRIFHGNGAVDITVFDEGMLREIGFNLMLSVSQGSAEEPKLLHLRYFGRPAEGDKTPAVDVALVGKGVTFDSGGISIKPSAGMASMKHDMMGAGTLLATFLLAVQQSLRINLTATFPLVENLPGPTATKPGDVFVSLSGKTVEVDNTDAEGRLILADGLTFAQRDKPEYLLDAATLTGAMVIALGTVYGGYFTNNEELSGLISGAGTAANDPLWRMPLSPHYREALVSHVADLNNMGGRDGGSAKAAEFLHAFVEEGVKWAHFDIAGLMEQSFNSELFGKHSTGRPVPAFIEIIERIADTLQ